MQVIDLYENSAILACPECRGPYIVTEFLDKRGSRNCPHCNSANGYTYKDALMATSLERTEPDNSR